jgi:ATP-dependent DNA ligase
MPNSFPQWIQPMAATLTQERFTGPEWSFERKFDGIRLLAYKKGKQVQLFSRNRLPQNIPAVSQAIAKLPPRELILDGEIDWHAVTGTHASSRVAYHVFDIMWFDGGEVMSLPLEERRTLLDQLPLKAPLQRVTELNVSEPIVSSPSGRGRVRVRSLATGSNSAPWELPVPVSVPGAVATGSNFAPWELAREQGWEGVIAKRRGSVYEQRRSRNWLKMKCELAQEFVVGGFTDPQGKRVGLGALLIGYYDRDDFVFAGKIGTGFNTELLLQLRNQLNGLEIPKPPFTKAIGLPRLRAHWVRPEIVVQVGFIQWTKHNKLRHPRLLGIRDDKDPRDVVRE